MLFEFTEEQLMIKQAAKDFAINECLPGVIERDEHQRFPKEQIEKLADLGFMGMMVKPEYGGSGMDTISYVLAMEEHLPNVIDTAVFQPLAPQSKPVLQILAVGRLGEEKRFDRFLRALAYLRREATVPVKGVIVGDGPMRATLEHQALELGQIGRASCRERV